MREIYEKINFFFKVLGLIWNQVTVHSINAWQRTSYKECNKYCFINPLSIYINYNFPEEMTHFLLDFE